MPKADFSDLFNCSKCHKPMQYDRFTCDHHVVYRCRHCGEELRSPFEVVPGPDMMHRIAEAARQGVLPVQKSLFD